MMWAVGLKAFCTGTISAFNIEAGEVTYTAGDDVSAADF